MYCKECGGQEFVNSTGPLGIIRTCRNCHYQFPALQDHLHAEPPQKAVTVDEKDLGEEAPKVEEVKEEKPASKRRTRAKSKEL